MEDFYQLFKYFRQSGKKVLATIVKVTGSSYKKEGSAMLFFEDGTRTGMVSAGCLETDLAYQAEKVLKTGQSIIIQYDMSEETSLTWGRGAGCNGIIEILLEPVTEDMAHHFLKIEEFLISNIQVLMLRKIQTHDEYLFIPRNGEPFGCWKGELSVVMNDVKNGLIENSTIFQYLFLPKPRLIVIGAGPDAIPLVSLAAATGFSVTVCDWREAFCKKENFPLADQLIVGFPAEIMKELVIRANDFVVIMSHDFARDQELLRAILPMENKYTGVLGPRERTKRLLEGHRPPNHLHSPVGLDIGARGPEEIAVSVVAEMIQVLRKSVREREEQLWTIPK